MGPAPLLNTTRGRLLLLVLGAAAFFSLTSVLLFTSMPAMAHNAGERLASARRRLTRRAYEGMRAPSMIQHVNSLDSYANSGGSQRLSKSDGDRLVQADRKLQLAVHTEPVHTAVANFADPPCKDENTNCIQWAGQGECDKNPIYMKNSCPAACNACADLAKRRHICHRTLETQPLLRPHGVDATFERLLAMLESTHEVIVHSRPPKGPWIITIEDFLADHEIRAMIEKGGHHFERSLAGDGVSPVRTSKTSWCNVPFCEGDPTIRSIKNHVANITGVPLANSEHVQVLHYEPGDFYRQHHDQNAHPQSPWGPRLFTFFLYLNDVEEGGGTRFNHLNITVEPKPGRALMWPSVYDEDPSAIERISDHRTTHEALTVTRGKKLAANMWLHQFDFQSTLAAGCKNEDKASCGDCKENSRRLQ